MDKLFELMQNPMFLFFGLPIICGCIVMVIQALRGKIE